MILNTEQSTPLSSPLINSPAFGLKSPVHFLRNVRMRKTGSIILVAAAVAFLLNFLAMSLGLTITNPFSVERHPTTALALRGAPTQIDSNGVYIRAIRLQDDSLLAGYTQHIDGQLVLLTAKSANDGLTWTRLGEVFRGHVSEHDCDNSFPLQLPSGRIIFAYRNHDRQNGAYSWFRISLSYSDDGGITFKYLSTIDERAAAGINGLWEPYMRVDRNGYVQAYYSAENSPADQDGLMRISKDGGQTWGDRIVVSGAQETSRDGMLGCTFVDDGPNHICVFETTELGYFTVSAVTSSDDGYTWGNRSRVYVPREGTDCHKPPRPFFAGAPQLCNVGGTLVASFMTNEDNDACLGYDGADMKVITSSDGGKTWSRSYVVGAAPAHWGGLISLSGGRFLALFEKDEMGALSQLVEFH